MGSEPKAKRQAVFFDRDGTLNVDTDYLHRPEDFRWMPDAIPAIRCLNERGILVVVVTNQSGVARGYYPEEDIMRLHAWMNEELEKEGAHIDAFFYCPHHPEAKLAQYRKNCACRKPDTGMVDEACEKFGIERNRSCLIGDAARDMECAQRAGLQGVLYTGGSLLAAVQAALEKLPD